ncbi:hypothetical protein PGB90_002043 [Kerria lacca]
MVDKKCNIYQEDKFLSSFEFRIEESSFMPFSCILQSLGKNIIWILIINLILDPVNVMVVMFYFTKLINNAFVILCWVLITVIIIISYWIGLPYWWNKSPVITICLLIFGNWLMINCIFHYYMGIICDPGHPPEGVFIEEVASVCKKCIQPKPHRTHHCSICNVCILQMDHHCPWLNNCVGHFNRRYFLMFMVYIEISVLFLITFGIEIAYVELWLNYNATDDDTELYGYPVEVNIFLPQEKWIMKPTTSEASGVISEEKYKSLRRKAILFAALICLGVAIAIGTLLHRHCKMISRGETSIEKHINTSERKKFSEKNEVYLNPYDFGKYRNWIIFLGIHNNSKRSWRHILFPSAHKPFGDGIIWPTIYSTESEWKNFFHPKY